MSSTCPHNLVNFGLLAAEIGWPVWVPLQISTGFASWQRFCMASSSGRQPNFAALNRGRHLYSAGRPSRWALAHISSYNWPSFSTVTLGWSIKRKLGINAVRFSQANILPVAQSAGALKELISARVNTSHRLCGHSACKILFQLSQRCFFLDFWPNRVTL